MFGKNKKPKQQKEKAVPQVRVSDDRNAFDWEDSHIEHLERSESRAWKVAGAFGCCFALSVVGIIMMLPLKETQPYVIRVDKTTGAVDVITALSGEDIAADEALDSYFVKRYITARESYDWSFLTDNYNAVREFTDEEAFKTYAAQFDGANSPEQVYGENTAVRVKIISAVLNMERKTATVRLLKEVVNRKTGMVRQSSNWIATLSYSYAPKLLKTTEMRDINPLGFTVENYQIDPEANQSPTTVSGANSPDTSASEPASMPPAPADANQ